MLKFLVIEKEINSEIDSDKKLFIDLKIKKEGEKGVNGNTHKDNIRIKKKIIQWRNDIWRLC